MLSTVIFHWDSSDVIISWGLLDAFYFRSSFALSLSSFSPKEEKPNNTRYNNSDMKYSSKQIKFILCKLNIIKSLSKFSLSFSNVKLTSELETTVPGAQGTG